MLAPSFARRVWRAGVCRAVLLAVLAAAALPAALRAQVVERPEAFDSAGRLVAITPPVAARLQLRPPAWRITGDFRDARLYNLSDAGYVIVVTRRNGTVERYLITAEDRAYLRARTRNLPPGLDEQISEGLAQVEQLARGGALNAFVRDQTILGLTVYAPSFAYAVTNEAAGRIATYLIVAGASFFGASSYARDFTVSPTQNRLATLGAVHVGAAGYGLAYALGASDDGQAVGIFAGSLAGTAAGLYFGRDMTPAQVAGAAFGADALGLVTAGLNGGAGNFEEGEDRARVAAATIVAAAALGTPLGAAYPKLVRYNVTAGDISTLWFTGGLGALGATSLVANEDPTDKEIMLALTGGFALGAVAGDRLLVKRMDHTAGDASLVGLGALAGALMGAGVSVLLDTDRSNDALIAGLATLGGVGGIAAAEYYAAPRADAGRLATRIQFSPTGLAMVAARQRGVHPIVSVTF
jgi:hypothetical protein